MFEGDGTNIKMTCHYEPLNNSDGKCTGVIRKDFDNWTSLDLSATDQKRIRPEASFTEESSSLEVRYSLSVYLSCLIWLIHLTETNKHA